LILLATLPLLLAAASPIRAEISLPVVSLPVRNAFDYPFELKVRNDGSVPVEIGPVDWLELVPERLDDGADTWRKCNRDPTVDDGPQRTYRQSLPKRTIPPGSEYSFGFHVFAQVCNGHPVEKRGTVQLRLSGVLLGSKVETAPVKVILAEPGPADAEAFSGKVFAIYRPESALALLDLLDFTRGLTRQELTQFRPEIVFKRVWGPEHTLARGEVTKVRGLAKAKDIYISAHPESPLIDDVRVSSAQDWLAVGYRATALKLIDAVLHSRNAHPEVRRTAEQMQRYLREHPDAAREPLGGSE